jgi:hypothetical protein
VKHVAYMWMKFSLLNKLVLCMIEPMWLAYWHIIIENWNMCIISDIEWQVGQITKVWSRDKLEKKMSFYKSNTLLSEASYNFNECES